MVYKKQEDRTKDKTVRIFDDLISTNDPLSMDMSWIIAEINAQTQINTQMDARLTRMEARLNRMEAQLNSLDAQPGTCLNGIDIRLDAMVARLNTILGDCIKYKNSYLGDQAQMEAKLTQAQMEARLLQAQMDTRIHQAQKELNQAQMDTKLIQAQMDAQLTKIHQAQMDALLNTWITGLLGFSLGLMGYMTLKHY
jgi:chromosome segregation ATPase